MNQTENNNLRLDLIHELGEQAALELAWFLGTNGKQTGPIDPGRRPVERPQFNSITQP